MSRLPEKRSNPSQLPNHRVVAVSTWALVAVATIGAVLLWPADDASAPTGTRAQSAGPTATAAPPSTVPAPTASIGAVPIATLPRPADLPPLESVDWTAGAVGDCLVQLPDEEALAVVGCAEAHDLQRVGAGSTDDLERLADLEVYDADMVRGAVTDTCAQEFWSAFPRTLGEFLGLDEHHLLFSGMAMGYRDPDHPINALRTRRDPIEDWCELRGFDE